MKNREKYREELINLIKLENNGADTYHSALCDFVKSKVLPNYTNEDCSNFWCITCTKMFAFWLDEEYTEVDWSKIPVDTLVRVRDHESKEWNLRYFKGIDDSSSNKFIVWTAGATSVTAEGSCMNWKYCELVEEDEQ